MLELLVSYVYPRKDLGQPSEKSPREGESAGPAVAATRPDCLNPESPMGGRLWRAGGLFLLRGKKGELSRN